ncbi:MAG: hypothetical protein ACRCVI_03045 [Mycoplasmoidaceae bacterium]
MKKFLGGYKQKMGSDAWDVTKKIGKKGWDFSVKTLDMTSIKVKEILNKENNKKENEKFDIAIKDHFPYFFKKWLDNNNFEAKNKTYFKLNLNEIEKCYSNFKNENNINCNIELEEMLSYKFKYHIEKFYEKFFYLYEKNEIDHYKIKDENNNEDQ